MTRAAPPEVYDPHTGERRTDSAERRPRLAGYPVAGAPAVLVLPGGGYHVQAPHEAEPIARWLNGMGLGAFVLYYRVAPDRHPAPLQDARAALRFLRRYDGVDPERIGVLGFSAGGHLAASLSVGVPVSGESDDPRPDLAVLCYPVISFERWSERGSVRNLIGEKSTSDSRIALSVEQHVDSVTPPTFLWHTAADELVDVRNSLLFAESLAEAEIPYELHVFPQGKHGLGLAEEDPVVGQWTGLCRQWFTAHGWLPESAK